MEGPENEVSDVRIRLACDSNVPDTDSRLGGTGRREAAPKTATQLSSAVSGWPLPLMMSWRRLSLM